MNKRIFFLLVAGILSLAAFSARAQDDGPQKMLLYERVVKTSLEGNRFEILVTSNEDIRTIYRFDKATGDLWELSNGFRPLTLRKYSRESDPDDVAGDGDINYQLVALSSSSLYLINLKTGVMWEKTPDDLFRRNTGFQVLKEQ